MQIVIEIPEESYQVTLTKIMLACRGCSIIELPKGHDRLIDAKSYYDNMKKHYFDNTTVMRCTEIGLGCAPTIIEADEAESEEEPYKEVEE